MGVVSVEEYKYRVRWRGHGKNFKYIPYAIILKATCNWTNICYVKSGRAYVKDDKTMNRLVDFLVSLGYTVDIGERPSGKWLHMVYDDTEDSTCTGRSYLAYIHMFAYNMYDLITVFLDEFTMNIVTMSKKVKFSVGKMSRELGVPPRMIIYMLYILQDEGYLRILSRRQTHHTGTLYSVMYRIQLY